MKLDFEDTLVIRDFEGFSLKAYQCSAGVWTISWGITGSDICCDTEWTQEECIARFMKTIDDFCLKLDKILDGVTLYKKQYIAVLSLTYNIGLNAFNKSTLLKKLRSGDMEAAADEFLKWNKVKGQPVAGLTKRRTKERGMFLNLNVA